MKIRKPYNRPFIKILHIDFEPILGVGTDANVHIRQIDEDDASKAQARYFTIYDDYPEDYFEEMDDDYI